MIQRIIELSARHRWIVFGLMAALAAWAVDSARKTPLDAVPDLSDLAIAGGPRGPPCRSASSPRCA